MASAGTFRWMRAWRRPVEEYHGSACIEGITLGRQASWTLNYYFFFFKFTGFRKLHSEQLVWSGLQASQGLPFWYRFLKKLQANITKLETRSKLIAAKINSPKRPAGMLIPNTRSTFIKIKATTIKPNKAPKTSIALRPCLIQKRALRLRTSHSCIDSISIDIILISSFFGHDKKTLLVLFG